MSLSFKYSLIILIAIVMLFHPGSLCAESPGLAKSPWEPVKYNQKKIFLFHSVIKRSLLFENEKFFSEMSGERKGIIDYYFELYAGELFKRRNQLPAETGFYGKNNSITDDRDIRREIGMCAGVSAFRETIKNTPLGINIERIAKKISGYLTVEYSKGINQLEPVLYLPGELNPREKDTKKDYYLSLSTSFDPDTDLVKGNIPIEIRFGYAGFSTNTIYDIGTQKLSINLYQKKLTGFPGMNFGISLNHEKRWEFIGLLQFSYDF
ncbi:MAG: hypothetical protein GY795_42975 [Desulfobacterales bacterium]|nr:hypothetical protein [Desulfobacterales bacterium]